MNHLHVFRRNGFYINSLKWWQIDWILVGKNSKSEHNLLAGRLNGAVELDHSDMIMKLDSTCQRLRLDSNTVYVRQQSIARTIVCCLARMYSVVIRYTILRP